MESAEIYLTWQYCGVLSQLASRPLPALLLSESSSNNCRDPLLDVLLPLLLCPPLPLVLLQSVHGDVHDAPHKLEVDDGANSCRQRGGDIPSLAGEIYETSSSNETEYFLQILQSEAQSFVLESNI